MPIYTDQINEEVALDNIPKRIISLVPSQTELLASFGLEEEVVGITKFCVHPSNWFREKKRVGGTKNVKPDVIAALQPDLIIANKEENVKEQVDALRKIAPVWTSDIDTVDDAMDMILKLGTITAKRAEAEQIVTTLRSDLYDLARFAKDTQPYKTVYLIWKDPYMAAGGDTFIHDMIERCGWTNAFAATKRYPQTTVEELIALSPELLLLSSEPYPFQQKHITQLQEHLPGCKIMLVDGEMFSWYGSRMLHAVEYLKQLCRTISTLQ